MSNTSPLIFLLLAACIAPVDGDRGDPNVNSTERDIQHYNELTQKLEQNRDEFMGEQADEVRAVGNRIFWLQFPQFAPDLYSWAPGESEATRYEFSIGGDAYNYSASEQMVVTASAQGQDLVYRAYAVTGDHALLGELEIDGPLANSAGGRTPLTAARSISRSPERRQGSCNGAPAPRPRNFWCSRTWESK